MKVLVLLIVSNFLNLGVYAYTNQCKGKNLTVTFEDMGRAGKGLVKMNVLITQTNNAAFYKELKVIGQEEVMMIPYNSVSHGHYHLKIIEQNPSRLSVGSISWLYGNRPRDVEFHNEVFLELSNGQRIEIDCFDNNFPQSRGLNMYGCERDMHKC